MHTGRLPSSLDTLDALGALDAALDLGDTDVLPSRSRHAARSALRRRWVVAGALALVLAVAGLAALVAPAVRGGDPVDAPPVARPSPSAGPTAVPPSAAPSSVPPSSAAPSPEPVEAAAPPPAEVLPAPVPVATTPAPAPPSAEPPAPEPPADPCRDKPGRGNGHGHGHQGGDCG
ncbi:MULTISPECIES: hypothetical protein [unclassified Geodermatophilus]